MASAARIFQKVSRAGRRMAITMSHRLDQGKQTLERLVHGGAYGPLGHLVGRLSVNNPAAGDWGNFRHRIADPLLTEAANHQLDVIRAIGGANARTVYARSWNVPWGEYAGDSNALAIIELENGVRAAYEGSVTSAATVSGWDGEYWRAECRDAVLELDNRRLFAISGAPDEAPSMEPLPLDERPAWMNSWLAEMFVGWLRGGPPPPTTLDANIHCQALTMAAIESAHTGQPVDVEAFLARHLEQAEAPAAQPLP